MSDAGKLGSDGANRPSGAPSTRDRSSEHGSAVAAASPSEPPPAYVPLVGLIAPVIFGLAYIRYLLGALHSSRAIEAPYGSHPNKELAAANTRP